MEYKDFSRSVDQEVARRLKLFRYYRSIFPHDAKRGERSWDIRRYDNRVHEGLVKWQDKRSNAEQLSRNGDYVDHYREGTMTYREWMQKETPYGLDEEGHFVEGTSANPDRLSDEHLAKSEAHRPAERILLDEALETLTEQQRRVWKLRMASGLTQEQAASRLRVSHQAVAKVEKTAIQRVASYIEANKYRIGELRDQEA